MGKKIEGQLAIIFFVWIIYRLGGYNASTCKKGVFGLQLRCTPVGEL